MKRLWTAAAIIALLLALSAFHVVRLDHLTGALTSQLWQVNECLSQEDWDRAESLTQSAYQDWESHAFYLHTTLHHADIDAIRASFREALAFLSLREDPAECAAVTSRLINQLELLLEAEVPSLKNLL